jgi:FAD-linked sulfhydryl oxidase
MLPPRRYVIFGLLFTCLITVLWIASFRFDDDERTLRRPASGPIGGGAARTKILGSKDEEDILGLQPGKAIAEKLGNETAKWVSCQRICFDTDMALCRAELGRAAWKVLHTTFAKFPDKPTPEESTALTQYINLFQRLYPWYDCSHLERRYANIQGALAVNAPTILVNF